MPAYPNHQDIRPAYVQSTDPGAVGAGVFWVDTTPTFVLRVRNFTDTGWDMVGSASSPITAVNGNYIVLATDVYLLVDASGGNLTVTLPDPSTIPGQLFVVKKLDATGFTVTVVGVGGELIDGQASQVISDQYVALAALSNGVLWYLV